MFRVKMATNEFLRAGRTIKLIFIPWSCNITLG